MNSGRRNFTTTVEQQIAEDFNKIALNLKKRPAALIRELVIAVVENRIKIISKNTDTEFHRNLYS